MKYGTTMSYLGEYTARVYDTETGEEDWYRPFATVQTARAYVEQRHPTAYWVRFSEYSRKPRPAKTHRHYLKGASK